MKPYLDLLRDILDNGRTKSDRTGVGTRSVFGRMVRFDLSKGFPLLTTKAVHWKGVVAELLWFLSGSTDNKVLVDQGVNIWTPWATEDGQLGPIYGKQWRAFDAMDNDGTGWPLDQLSLLVDGLRFEPFSRRHVVTAWNPGDIPISSLSPQDNVSAGFACLAPCHMLFQVIVEPLTAEERIPYLREGAAPVGRLSLMMTQRSADCFIGVPFNIASYALLTHMLAAQANMVVGDLVISFGDLHLYQNHIHPDIVFAQLAREPKDLPRLELTPRPSLFDYRLEDCKLVGYNPHPAIKAKVAV